jgi:hypothetical protein
MSLTTLTLLDQVESTGWIHDSLVEGNSASSAGAMKLAGSNVTFEKLTIRRVSALVTGGTSMPRSPLKLSPFTDA